jgi:hypothetical protein
VKPPHNAGTLERSAIHPPIHHTAMPHGTMRPENTRLKEFRRQKSSNAELTLFPEKQLPRRGRIKMCFLHHSPQIRATVLPFSTSLLPRLFVDTTQPFASYSICASLGWDFADYRSPL